MEKKNRPLQAANSDIRVSDITPLTKSLQAPKRTPKKHRARVYMLRTGIEGWTENDILRYCRLSSGRNYATELERQLGITLERIDEKNPDGIGTHLRYRFSCRGDVLKVITHVNHLANINDHNGLSQQEIADILKLYRRQLKARISAANNFKPMCDALNMARAEQGKTTQQHHYTNESNMISRIVLGGLTAKQWARINGYSGEPRDHMNAEQLEHLSYLESTNITLIDMGMEYEQRKGELTRLSQRWLAKRLEAVHV
ncbi:hypothetical protein GP697_18275 [Escherichia coli]|nr:hypothetical protein [Escherichia coli]KAE9885524.1 hypothetical protein GP698_21415 [Escherichia coli]MVV78844.1 hypothetical protein [Escherichia coli]